jgi:hypothetical protein
VLPGVDDVPHGRPEIPVLARVLGALQHARDDVLAGKVGDGIASRLVQQHDVLAVCDPLSAEPNAHATAEGLGEQQPLG